jgi:RNA polymerase sigma factor for flagellar operon FliA
MIASGGGPAPRTARADRRTSRTKCAWPSGVSNEEKLRRHLPLVHRIVQRLASRKPPQIELDDLVSWGVVGLLDAIGKYDSRKEAAFSTYAQFRIRGAIMDHLRSLDWVPRSVRQKAQLVEKISRRLEGALGRIPTHEEMASELGLSLDGYQALLASIGDMMMFSLEDVGFGNGEERLNMNSALKEDDEDPLHELLTQERIGLVAEAVESLPEREKLVVNLYYGEDLTMKEVGTVLGLTESRVSQLHSQAMDRLKRPLARHFGPVDGES